MSGSVYRVPFEPFRLALRELLGGHDKRNEPGYWLTPLAEALGYKPNSVSKAMRRAAAVGSISLRMVEDWCDAMRVHPTTLVAGYYDHVEADLARMGSIDDRQKWRRYRDRQRAASSQAVAS